MKIYFVSGFLGSGKTTSIINASRILMKKGLKTGVVTNDQGRYLVDNYFVNASGIPSVEVANGCFCCNYDDFDSHLFQLAETEKPDIIFAESVGSCADIIATVMKPLNEFRKNYSLNSSLTAFTDVRLLRARTQGGKLPFSDDVIYIFDKQIEEADILVINKSDLFSVTEGEELVAEAKYRYPDKTILLQSTFNDSSLETWISKAELIADNSRRASSIEMDYERYASGELKLAWFDKVFDLESKDEIGPSIEKLFRTISSALQSEKLGTGHLKLFVKPSEHKAFKLSLTGMDDDQIIQKIPACIGKKVEIVLNARVETEPVKLEIIINRSIKKIIIDDELQMLTIEENVFRPGRPKPVHRFV